MRIGVLVVSHVKYCAPLQNCVDTLGGFADRLIVVGGCDERRLGVRHGTVCLEVEQNSFDYTGLIEMVNNPVLVEGWTHLLCLQDTMEATPIITHELCKLARPEAVATAASGGQSNLVLYQVDYLMSRRDFINARFNCTKRDSVDYEGALWRGLPEGGRDQFRAADCVVLDKGCPFGNTTRIKEFYTALAVTKWKANWGQSMEHFSLEP